MSNWTIDPETETKWKPFIIALHKTIYNNEDLITSLPNFEKVIDFGIVPFRGFGEARKLTVTYSGKDYTLGIHMYNRHNGNCLAVSDNDLEEI